MPCSEFGRLIAEETEKWGKVVSAAGIKPESGGLKRQLTAAIELRGKN